MSPEQAQGKPDWDFISADREMKRALELEPGNHWLRYAYYENLRIFGWKSQSISNLSISRTYYPTNLNIIRIIFPYY
jgi:hypothetical protein